MISLLTHKLILSVYKPKSSYENSNCEKGNLRLFDIKINNMSRRQTKRKGFSPYHKGFRAFDYNTMQIIIKQENL